MLNITPKYNKLSPSKRKEVNDFIDHLLHEQERRKSNKKTLENYKKKILNVPQWTEEDCRIIDKNQKLFNQWPIQEW